MRNTIGALKAELSRSGVNVEESPTAEGSSNRGEVDNGVKSFNQKFVSAGVLETVQTLLDKDSQSLSYLRETY